MRKSLVASLAVFLVAVVSVHAQGIKRMPAPNSNIQFASGACAPGFTKQGAVGDPSSRYKYDCVMLAQCPGVSTQAGPVQHPGGANSAQFRYACWWNSGSQQGVPQSAICAPGFVGGGYSNIGSTTTVTASSSTGGTAAGSSNTTYRGSYTCDSRPIVCQAVGGLYASMTAHAGTLTTPPRRAQLVYSCSYVRVN